MSRKKRNSLTDDYADKSQKDIHAAVVERSTELTKLRGKDGYEASLRRQILTRERTELQALLKPELAWSAS